MNRDFWIASLSNGNTVIEYWIPNELSPWSKLMDQCKAYHVHLVNLRLTICSKTISLKPYAQGYWQIHQRTFLHIDKPISRGIGFVDNNLVKIVWGVRAPNNQSYFWSEERSIDGQGCIIWSAHNKVFGGIDVKSECVNPYPQ